MGYSPQARHGAQGPAGLGLTSRAASPPDTRPPSKSAQLAFPRTHCAGSCPTPPFLLTLACPSIWSTPVPPLSAWKEGAHLLGPHAATVTTVSSKSPLSSPGRGHPHLFIVLCTHCTSPCTPRRSPRLRTPRGHWVHLPRPWPRTGPEWC